MSTNLNDTVPAAPAGGVNVKWQQDVSGNTSAYVSLNSGGKQTVAPVAGVLTIDASTGSSFLVNVTAAITSMSITNPTDGQLLIILWNQDGTGHAITPATNLAGFTAPSTTANSQSIQAFLYNGPDTTWYGVAAGQTGL